jgi:hypothetical protein
MRTLAEWQTGEHGGFSKYCKPFDQVDREIYDYFLEILPPMYKTSGFMVSEPYDYDYECNQSTYAAFCHINGAYYFLGDIAPKKYSEKLETLKGKLL